MTTNSLTGTPLGGSQQAPIAAGTTDSGVNQDKNQSCCGPKAPPVQASSCCGEATDSAQTEAQAACDTATATQESGGGCCAAPSKPRNRMLSTLKQLRSPWTVIALVPLLVMQFDSAHFGLFLETALSAFAATLPFIIFAVFLIAVLKASGAETQIGRAFQGRENRMIVLAAMFGGLAPFCSCEVIPFIAGLLAVGTPLPAVMAFWLSSPLIDPPSLVITAGALGWPFAIMRIAIAVGLGLAGGFMLKSMMSWTAFRQPLRIQPKPACRDGNNGNGKAVWKFWESEARLATFRTEARNNSLFLVKWMLFAYIIEALFILYIPAESVATLVGGDGLISVIIGAAVGMPAYLNSYAAPPLVSGLMEQGMSAGAAMAFMTAGAISSIPAMTAVWSLVNRQVFAAYLVFGFSGAVAFGWLFGWLVG